MRTARQRAADTKLIAGATVAVLLAGGLIAAGLFIATDDNPASACGTMLAGTIEDVVEDLEAGPAFRGSGGRCSVWLALEDDEVVAFLATQPSGCTLDVRRQEFVCGGEPVDTSTLAQYPVRVVEEDDIEYYVVDLEPPA